MGRGATDLNVCYRHTALAVVAITAMISAIRPAAAQETQRVDLGEWVRLSTRQPGQEPAWVVGALAASTDLYLVVEPIASAPLAVPHTSLTRLEVQRGWSSRARRGGLVGAITGIAASAAVGLIANCLPACMLVGAPLGTGAGVFIGTRHVRMRWESVAPTLLRPNIQAQARPSVGFAIAAVF